MPLCRIATMLAAATRVAVGFGPGGEGVISGAECGRRYDGIGGLSNSCAPWLKAYPPEQLDDILDVLFKPRWAAAVQVST